VLNAPGIGVLAKAREWNQELASMYGVPATSELQFLVGLSLLQVCVGEYQVILNLDSETSISLECDMTIDGYAPASMVECGSRVLPLVGSSIRAFH
jgi:hypothetical protein